MYKNKEYIYIPWHVWKGEKYPTKFLDLSIKLDFFYASSFVIPYEHNSMHPCRFYFDLHSTVRSTVKGPVLSSNRRVCVQCVNTIFSKLLPTGGSFFLNKQIRNFVEN
jgi:hypothetical protein